MSKFKQHDWVDFAGIRGVVLTTSGSNAESPLQVVFAAQKAVLGFDLQGRFGGKIYLKEIDATVSWHVDDKLKLVKRQRKSFITLIKSLFKRSK